MVEHDLAKVGVASSNLVSRSILIVLLLNSIMFADNRFVLKSYYCLKNQNVLYLKNLFPSQNKNFKILNIPKELSLYEIPSIDIISDIKKIIDLNITDDTQGIVSLDKQCFVNYKKNMIKKILTKTFKTKYKNIKIISLNIKPINRFPKNISQYKIAQLKISPYNLRNKKGRFFVLYEKNNQKMSRIYFDFNLKAKILLFKAKNNIPNGKIINSNDYEKVMTVFNKIPIGFINNGNINGFVAKNYILKGRILTTFLIKKSSLIRKRDEINAIIKSGALSIEFSAKALDNGNKGDIIKIIGNNGKIYKAKILNRFTVEVE